MKNPWLSASLNLIPLPVGLGYLYLGKIGRAFAVFFLGWIVTFGIGVALYSAWERCAWDRDCAVYLIVTLLILFFAVPVGIIICAGLDAWRLANNMNNLREVGSSA